MNWHIVLAVFFAALAPGALIATGRELRRVRLRIVEDLRNTVFAGHERDLPQLLLAQARYAPARKDIGGAGGRQDEAKQFIGGIVYAAVSVLGFIILFDPIPALIGPGGHLPIAESIIWAPTADALDLRRSAAIAGFAFLGGYVFNLSYLIRQTLNQELSALAFVRAALRLIQGMFLAVVAYHAIPNVLPDGWQDGAVAGGGFAIGLAAAFVFGYFPEVVLARMARSARVTIKDMNEEAIRQSRVVPLEVIDGIDHVISFRLQESNLFDVQNLAVANPIEVYAETPYTLLQTFDWVLQAQLCVVVGVEAFFELKRHRIRTIFDLERAVLSKGVPAPYLQGIASVLLRDSSACFRTAVGLSAQYADCSAAPGPDSVTMIRHLVAIISDDLHVHRLRALWIAIMNNTAGVTYGSDGQHKPLWLFDVGWLPGDPGSGD